MRTGGRRHGRGRSHGGYAAGGTVGLQYRAGDDHGPGKGASVGAAWSVRKQDLMAAVQVLLEGEEPVKAGLRERDLDVDNYDPVLRYHCRL
jgi:hypothetical protein